MYEASKFNRFNKSSLRALVITDKFIAKFDAVNFKLLKEPIPLQNVSRISICPEPNGLFVIHVAENDIVGCAKNAREEERIGELVGTLLAQYEKYAYLSFLVHSFTDYRMRWWQTLCWFGIFPADPTQQAVFKKNGNDIDLICHTMSAA
ncbi:hypothetical protein OSTOST_09571 [Ostertagia ostertagi]